MALHPERALGLVRLAWAADPGLVPVRAVAVKRAQVRLQSAWWLLALVEHCLERALVQPELVAVGLVPG